MYVDINECGNDSASGSGSGRDIGTTIDYVIGSGDFLGPCGLNQTCINTLGSFSCLCPSGFTNVDGVCVGKSSLWLQMSLCPQKS